MNEREKGREREKGWKRERNSGGITRREIEMKGERDRERVRER